MPIRFWERERKIYGGGLVLTKMAAFPKLPIKLATMSIFEYQENAFSVIEPLIEWLV